MANKTYYLKNTVTFKLNETLDFYAVALIKNDKNDVIFIANLNEEISILKSGKYTVTTINHAGKNEYSFIISLTPSSITAEYNSELKAIEVALKPSFDVGVYLVDVQIYCYSDSGNWLLLTHDDNGIKISTSTLAYTFFEPNLYRIVLEDSCRNGLEKIVFEVELMREFPQGNLVGVSDNGYTNNAVSFDWSGDAKTIYVFNEIEFEYLSNTLLTADGDYKIILFDDYGFYQEFSFVIDTTPPFFTLQEEILEGHCKENAIIWSEENVIATLYLNGEIFGEYENGAVLTRDGHYRIELKDMLNNLALIEFIIDNTAPTLDLIGVENYGKTNSEVSLTNLSEQAKIVAYFNGVEFEYSIGTILIAIGNYRFEVIDEGNNLNVYEFEIIYSVNTAGMVLIVILVIAIIAGAITIFIMRKRIKFKKKT